MKEFNIDRINAKAPYDPLLTSITADFDETAVSLTNKPSE